MELTELAKVAKWANGNLFQLRTDGSLVDAASGVQERRVTTICTDSRKIQPGDVFWPLVGERFDGHDYIPAAVKAGATCTACDRKRLETVVKVLLEQVEPKVLNELSVIVVEDTLTALSALARGYREQFAVPIVAVTGSVGKTTTKDLTAAVLSQRYYTLKTKGNYNNEIGLPLTLLNLTREHGAAVVEMGMRGLGQIADLAKTAQPVVGIVTNVEPVHIELLGSLEKIAEAKQELIQALPPEGTAILNWDNSWVRGMAGTARCQVLTYGTSAAADLRILRVEPEGDHGISVVFGWKRQEYEAFVPIPGKHNAYNAAAAVLAGIACGLDIEVCIGGLHNYEASGLRMEITSDGLGTTVVNDAYNANPKAMRAAISATLDIAKDRPVWLVLGDMLELGPLADSAHRDLGRWVGRQNIEKLICVGRYGDIVAQGAKMAGFPASQVVVVPDAASCTEYLADESWQGAVILIKGSRSVGLEQVAEYCRQRMLR